MIYDFCKFIQYICFFFHFLVQNYIIYTTHNTILNLQYRHICELY